MEKSRKRLYRSKIKCSNCGKEIDSDYKKEHIRRAHDGDQNIKFMPITDPKQRKLSFDLDVSTSVQRTSGACSYSEEHKKQDLSAAKQNMVVHGALTQVQVVEECTSAQKMDSGKKAAKFPDSPEKHSEEYKTARRLEATTDKVLPSTENTELASHPRPTSSAEVLDAPNQPLLSVYNRKTIGNEKGTRDFNPELFKKYPWASYNKTLQLIECYICQKYRNDDSFSFCNWKKPERLGKHALSKTHKLAMTQWITSKINQKKQTSILSQLDSAHKEMVRKNRDYMKVIIETLIYIAQQNLSLRGHEEIRTNLMESSEVNRGNFLELLHLRCRDIPWLAAELRNHQESHALWLSPEIQNELLVIASDLVLRDIARIVQEAEKYSIIVDETSDISNKEQVSVCLRYVHNGETFETFIGFYETKSAEGEVLFELVKNVLRNIISIRLEDMVGECFDGASNMSGSKKGVAARIQEVAPLAIYVHCYGHLLSLALQDTLEENFVMRNALGVVQSLYNFFNCPKRQNVLKDVILQEDEFKPYIKLKSMSETRWACRWEAVKAIEQQLVRITIALMEISNMKDAKTSVDARCLLTSVCDLQFIIGLEVLKVIFCNTNALSRHLQGKDLDAMSAKITGEATIKTLMKCRDEENFSLLWQKAKTTADKINQHTSEVQPVSMSLHRKGKPSRRLQALTGESQGREEMMSDEQRARTDIYYDSLDRVVTEMHERFNSRNSNVLTSLAKVIMGDANEENYKVVADFYALDEESLKSEQEIYHNLENDRQPKTASEITKYLVSNSLSSTLPNFSTAAKILATIPATSCSAERSFSCLRRLKTYLRSTMGQERLSSLAILSIERHYVNKINTESIIDIFGRRHGRDKHFF